MGMNIKTLKVLRKERKLSQYKLGKLSQVSRNKISLAECGYGTFTKQEFVRIQKVLMNRSSNECGK